MVIKNHFIHKLTFEERSKGDNGINHGDIWKKNFQEEGTKRKKIKNTISFHSNNNPGRGRGTIALKTCSRLESDKPAY